MRKKLVNQKRDALKQLDRKELIDHICEYPDRAYLDYDETGKRRTFPVGMIANDIKEKGYEMSDRQYYGLLHSFAGLTVPEMRVVGVTFRPHNAADYEKKFLFKNKNVSGYETDYILRPEPENPYDPNAVMVLAKKTDGTLEQVGYLNREFVAAHPLTEEITVQGWIVDHSNGKFRNVSYQLAVDIEAVDGLWPVLTDADLHGIGDLGLDIPEHQELGYKDPTGKHRYEVPFSLNYPVSDLPKARAFLLEQDHLADFLKQECNADGIFSVSSVQWKLDTETNGRIEVISEQELPRTTLDTIYRWAQQKNQEGLYGFTSCVFAYTEPFMEFQPDGEYFGPDEGITSMFNLMPCSSSFVETTPNLDFTEEDLAGLMEPPGLEI